ncbi:MAG TPA: glycoside hydrolase domain-containing protein [Polyangia bacterium]
MQTHKLVTLVAALATLASSSAFAQSVWTASATQKIRPTDAAGGGSSATLEAARNEFEAFHVVINGGSAGAKQVSVAADPLSGPSGSIIGEVHVFREGMYNVATPSNLQGTAGAWPDAMIPSVDEIDNQPRNAFPVDVAAGAQQPVFVEYHVPEGAAAGWYAGTVHVTGGVTADVPVKLYVHAFTLPSTSSLPTAYGIGWDDACTAHYGGYTQCGGDAGVQALNNRYTRFALDHRISLSEVVYSGPSQNSDGSYDWATWDATYGPMLDGGMGGALVGAKLTAVRYMWTVDQAHYAEWAKHFRAKGWLDRTFDYSCDEPPAGCAWSSINARTAMVHAADPDFTTLVTTQLAPATQNGVVAGIDALVPTDNLLDPMPPSTNTRTTYDPFLAISPQKKVWMYQSCDSDGCDGIGDATQSGWPSHMIDAPATQNRAMEWQAWRQKVSGELYYDTTYAFTRGDAWSAQYYFGGNGDGTLFYPGTPAKIGGTTHIPIASFRLKMIREGMEDYEYFKALSDAGDAAMADTEAAGLSPSAYNNMTDPAQIDAARHRIALRIEALTGQTPPPMDGAGGSTDTSGGSGVGGNGASSGDTGAGMPAPTATSATGGHGGCAMAGGAGDASMALVLFALALAATIGRRVPAGARVRR